MEETFSDDSDRILEKRLKRKIKTPHQIEALERLYDEHKYPAELLKLQLAESVGLTEKQVSGWFCHKRLMEKKLKDDSSAHGKQYWSSGVIQDRGSGLGQDPCGSTKQGEQRHSEPREVESGRFIGEEFSGAADIKSEPEDNYIQSHNGRDDTSLGRSSYLQDNYFPQSTDPHGIVTSVNMVGKGGNSKLIDEKGSKVMTNPSQYLKVKALAKHVVVASLKRQLGRHYREDGPPPGIDFDPLPPSAFKSPVKDAVEVPKVLTDPANVDGRLADKANEHKKRKKTGTSSTAPKVTPNQVQDSSTKQVTPPPNPKDKGPIIVQDSLCRSPKKAQTGPLNSQLNHLAVPASTASVKIGQDLTELLLLPGDAPIFSKYSLSEMFDQVLGHLSQVLVWATFVSERAKAQETILSTRKEALDAQKEAKEANDRANKLEGELTKFKVETDKLLKAKEEELDEVRRRASRAEKDMYEAGRIEILKKAKEFLAEL